MKITDTHVYFYTYKDIPSQHYPSPFTVKGITFKTAEHFMMFCKACLMDFGKGFKFTDMKTLMDNNPDCIQTKIINAPHPQDAKKLGRQIKNFDSLLWDASCEYYVYWGNVFKFTKCPECKEFMLKMGNRSFVEASDRDTIWGVGLSEDDPRILDEKQWLGTNKLGKCLTEVSLTLRKEEGDK